MEKSKEEFLLQAAHEQHRRLDAFLASKASTVDEKANAAIKSVFLLNGGAAVAVLAFASASLADDRLLVLVALETLFIFAIGTALAAMAGVAAYVTEYGYLSNAGSKQTQYEEPFVSDTSRSVVWKWVGFLFHLVGVLCVLASLGAFLAGVWEIKDQGIQYLLTSEETSE